jgi:pimeloyl-ACP methyl ester carboxylesterase
VQPTPQEAVWAPGPWTHRDIAANGVRFHAASIGSGPLVVLLHGFPQYWWTWRLLLPRLAEAGYNAVAVDLRGYGGSDHTPHGYDPFTLSADAAGIIRSLGQSEAVVVGHGWGGLIAWSAAVLRRPAIRAIAPVSMPHPNMLRRLVRDDAAEVERLLHEWSGSPGWPGPDDAAMYRSAIRFGATAHCALEYHRWAIRSIPRPDGRRFAERMEEPVHQPVLQIVGRNDGALLPSTYDGSDDFVAGRYERHDMAGVGHFPQEEDADRFNDLIVRWLESLD